MYVHLFPDDTTQTSRLSVMQELAIPYLMASTSSATVYQPLLRKTLAHMNTAVRHSCPSGAVLRSGIQLSFFPAVFMQLLPVEYELPFQECRSRTDARGICLLELSRESQEHAYSCYPKWTFI